MSLNLEAKKKMDRRQFISLFWMAFIGAALLPRCVPPPFPIEDQEPEDLESFVKWGDYERFIISVGVQKLPNEINFGSISDEVRSELQRDLRFWTRGFPGLPSYEESRNMSTQEIEQVQRTTSEQLGEIFFRMENSEIPIFRSLAEANKEVPLQPVSFMRRFPSRSLLPDKRIMGADVQITTERKLQTGIYFNIEVADGLTNIGVPVGYWHELSHIAYANKIVQTYYDISKNTDEKIPVGLEEAFQSSSPRDFLEAWPYWNQAQLLNYLSTIDGRYVKAFSFADKTVLEGWQNINKDPSIPQGEKFWYKSPWHDNVSNWLMFS